MTVNNNKIRMQRKDEFTPWQDQNPPLNYIQSPYSVPPQPLRKIKSLQPNQDSIQEQAKKTLLNLQFEARQKQVQKLKKYLQLNSPQKGQSSMSVGLNDLRLPKIHKQRKSLQSGIPRQHSLKQVVIDDVFKKYGSHRRKKHIDRVQRSVSFGKSISKVCPQLQVQGKYSTIDTKNQMHLRQLRLRGKRLAKSSVAVNSAKLQSGDFNYLPSQPNITPHYLLMGHNREDILKKVMNQLLHKFK